MSKNDDGGPVIEPVCSLRDWYAGMALQGLIAGCLAGNNSGCGWSVEGNVFAAYQYADAMIAERKKGVGR